MKKFALIVIGLYLLGFGARKVYDMTRGLRNNNPGNIRRSSTQWEGLSKSQTDPEFFQFVTPEYGIRAMVKILKTYEYSYGLKTIRKVISRWAPPSENDTESYVNSVASSVGIDPDMAMSPTAYIVPLIKAIIKHENGLNPYQDATIDSGVEMAGIDPVYYGG